MSAQTPGGGPPQPPPLTPTPVPPAPTPVDDSAITRQLAAAKIRWWAGAVTGSVGVGMVFGLGIAAHLHFRALELPRPGQSVTAFGLRLGAEALVTLERAHA